MAANEPSPAALREVRRYNRFLDEQGGVYPATIAATVLRCSVQNLHYLAGVGHLKVFRLGKKRLYGKLSVEEYRWITSRKFLDNGSRIKCRRGDNEEASA